MIPGYTKEAFIKFAAPKRPAYVRTRPQGVKLRHMPSVGMMYDAYKYAETGSMLKPGDPEWWKRTTDSTDPGSSAFGPVQITENTMNKAFLYHPTFKKRYGAWYEQNMRPMQKNFLKHGLNSHKPWYDKRYDYGGDGYWDHKNNAMYTNMAKDIMRLKMLDADKALNKLPADNRTPNARVLNHIQTWRGEPMSKDQAYYDKVLDNLYKNYPGLFDDYDESKIDPKSMAQRNTRLNQIKNTWTFK